MSVNTTIRRSSRAGESVPYVIDRYSGRKSNLGGDVFWAPVGGDETDGEFALIRTATTQADEPVTPMHYHEDEQDVFICLRGRLQVWADGNSRMLGPGDFASVPPGTHHSYRPASPRTEMIGLIDTGGWEGFFFEGGQSHDGPPFCETTGLGGKPGESGGMLRSVAAPLLRGINTANFIKTSIKYGVNRSDEEFIEPDHTSTDHELPGSYEAYFLEAGHGPQHALGGTLATTVCSAAESDGDFGIVTYEGPEGTGLPAHEHRDASKAIYVVDGQVTGELAGETYTAREGQCINVPPGSTFSYSVASTYANLISFTSGGSAHRLAEAAGEPWSENHNPAPDATIDRTDLDAAAEEIDIVFE